MYTIYHHPRPINLRCHFSAKRGSRLSPTGIFKSNSNRELCRLTQVRGRSIIVHMHGKPYTTTCVVIYEVYMHTWYITPQIGPLFTPQQTGYEPISSNTYSDGSRQGLPNAAVTLFGTETLLRVDLSSFHKSVQGYLVPEYGTAVYACTNGHVGGARAYLPLPTEPSILAPGSSSKKP